MDKILAELQSILANVQPDASGEAQIPTERELAEALQVHRTTLRERLAVLEMLGLIRRTQGSGTYLALPDPGFVRFYFQMALKLKHIQPEQLQQARELLEIEVARLAAASASPDDVAALVHWQEQLAEAETIEAETEADHQFHIRLARASRNPVIMLIMEGFSSALREVLIERRRLFRQVPGGWDRSRENHAAIAAAIRDRDPDRAMEAMRRHFETWNQAYSQLARAQQGRGSRARAGRD